MLLVGLIVFLIGIIELLEFLFLFVVLVFYGIYVLLVGILFLVMYLLGVKIGMIFLGGFIDYILYGLLNWDRLYVLLVILVGIVYVIVYYFLFDFVICKFKLKILGCEDEEIEICNFSVVKLLFDVLDVMGGKENIKYLDVCIICLCVEVVDKLKVDVVGIKVLGVLGVLEVGNNM